MKLGVHIAVMGVLLTVASGGVLYPIYEGVAGREGDVATLQSEKSAFASVHDRFMQAQKAVIEVEQRVAARHYALCPDSPEAHQNFEGTLLRLVDEAGLYSIRMDRRTEVRSGPYGHLDYELIVEGDAFALHEFLVGLDTMQWVTRVASLSVEPGEERRRISLQFSVILEKKGQS